MKIYDKDRYTYMVRLYTQIYGLKRDWDETRKICVRRVRAVVTVENQPLSVSRTNHELVTQRGLSVQLDAKGYSRL